MSGLRVRLLGRTAIEVDGHAIKLTSKTLAVLIRLVIADGAALTTDEIHRDIWPDAGRLDHAARTKVQRRIMDIRNAVDPDHPGEQSEVVITERGRTTTYQLVVPPGAVDVFQFIDLVTAARTAAASDKIAQLKQALGLWRGEPLADFQDQRWAAQRIRQLNDLRKTATDDLMEALDQAGRGDEALSTGERLSWANPEDAPLAEKVEALRAQMRGNQRKKVFREDYPTLRSPSS